MTQPLPIPTLPLRTEDALARSLAAFLDAHARVRAEGVWLFVYGLLAQEPPFVYEASRTVVLEGQQRRFNLWDPENRGTPEAPGLTLGLEMGERCEGVGYLIPAAQVEDGLRAVWKQEMLLPFYTPTMLEIEGTDMLVMMTDPASPALTDLNLAETAQLTATRAGKAGRNRDYLADVRRAFAGYGIRDAYLDAVWDAGGGERGGGNSGGESGWGKWSG